MYSVKYISIFYKYKNEKIEYINILESRVLQRYKSIVQKKYFLLNNRSTFSRTTRKK